MLTAHLPSGYVLGRSWARGVPYLMPAALVGAVLPDIDMIWFAFDGSVHHHRYWTHIPLFWLIVALIVLPCLRGSRWIGTGGVFFAAIFMHLMLDTISGGILWAMSFSAELISFVAVQPTHSHWVLSFMMHWTFLLELMIWATALVLMMRRSR